MKTINKMMKTIVCFALILMMLASTSIAEAKSCKHDFGSNDVCKKCGYTRIHSFDSSITFYTIKDNVPVWSKPTKNSKTIKTITDKNSKVQVDGILRNQYGNIWLKVSDQQQFIYIDNLFLDFGTLVAQSFQQIIAWKTDKMKMTAFFDLVQPGGHADFKRWLDPGNKQFTYTVRFDGTTDYAMTAEQLGNIHYGFLARAIGLNDNVILYGGGVVNQLGHLNWKYAQPYWKKGAIECIGTAFTPLYPICVLNKTTESIMKDIYYECAGSYCDNADDAANVAKGIEYYNTGVFVW